MAVLGDAARAEPLRQSLALPRHDAEEDVLGGDVLVLEGGGLGFGLGDGRRRVGGQVELRALAEDLGHLGERPRSPPRWLPGRRRSGRGERAPPLPPA